MDNQQEGIVLQIIEGNLAKVKASRHNNCENCGACPGNSAMVLEVRNDIGAKLGQHVVFEVPEVNMLKAAFIVYILPLIAAFVGVVLGWKLAAFLGIEPIWLQVAGGVMAFILSVVYIKYIDSTAKYDVKMQPFIIRILS